MGMTAQIIQKISADYFATLDIGQSHYEPLKQVVTNLSNGTGADQANAIWTDERTLSASANEDLDLAGSLSDAFGNTLTFTRVKGILVYAASGNTNNVNVTRPASNGVPLFLAAGDGIAVRPNGCFTFVAPDATAVAVTAGTGDLLNIANSSGGTAVTYQIMILGTI